MKVTLYMAMTANGMIARKNDDAPWSKEVWSEYYKFVKQKRNIIVGRRTFDLMNGANEFEKLGFPVAVVLSGKSHESGKKVFFAKTPEEALRIMKKNKIRNVVIGGGSKCNAAFLKSGLINEIVIDMEPFIFGDGIRLFSEVAAEAVLDLVKIRKLSKNTVRLVYRVKNRGKKD